MIVRNSLLAMLATEPTHGYALKSHFEDSTAGVWPLNVGQVYSTLARLERDGLVQTFSSDDPDRNAWQITDQGRVELAAWYQSPVDERSTRDELIIKVLVAVASDDTKLIQVLDTQRAATMQRLQDYTRQKQALDPEADLSSLLLIEALILRADAEVRWLDRCEARLSSKAKGAS